MDVEKTLQLVAESQLRAEKRAELADKRADRADQRADRADQRMDKFDKKLNATANLVREGMKMVREMRQSQKEMQQSQREMQQSLDYKFNALMDSQLRTEEVLRGHDLWLRKHDQQFNRLLDILRRRNGNGHK